MYTVLIDLRTETHTMTSDVEYTQFTYTWMYNTIITNCNHKRNGETGIYYLAQQNMAGFIPTIYLCLNNYLHCL